MSIPHLGEIFSVLTAIVWAVSVVLFRMSGRRLAPLELNFFKNIVASVLLLATIVVLREPLFRAAPLLDYVLLAVSGIIGIALADTIFFQSLNIVGAGLSQIVSLAYGPFIIILAFVFLGERLTVGDLAGAGLITVGILLTTSHRSQPGITPHDLRKGVALASPRHRRLWATLKPSPSWKVAIPAAVTGAYLAMVLWIAGMKYTQASTAAILNQTSAVFVLPIAALVLHEAITRRKLAAVALSMAGIVLVTLT